MPIVGQFGSLAALGSLILPGGAMESIATVSVGSGGASSIEFTSIPGTYQHLQIRVIARGSTSGTNPDFYTQLNGDTANNYTWHVLTGNGSSASANGGGTGNAFLFTGVMAGASASTNVFSGTVIDILDYGSTSKNKTVRVFTGLDNNGSGLVGIESGAWLSTSAVTSLKLLLSGANTFSQHSTAALYGLRAP